MNNSKNTLYLDKKKHTLIFFHLPKTGGTTMHVILRRHYRSAHIFRTDPEAHWESLRIFRELSDEEKSKYQLITGHMRFGIHDDLKKPSYYITFLRDPVQRVISYYYYILGYQNHYLHQRIKSGNMSLQEVVESGISREFENCQARRIAGLARTKYGEPPAEMFDLAVKNIERYFLVVGTTECFDESLMLMANHCRWNLPYYTKQNTGKNKPRKLEISDEAIKTIKKFNEVDIKLYEYASRKLQEHISDLGPPFTDQLKRFRTINRVYSYAHSLRNKARK